MPKIKGKDSERSGPHAWPFFNYYFFNKSMPIDRPCFKFFFRKRICLKFFLINNISFVAIKKSHKPTTSRFPHVYQNSLQLKFVMN